MTVRSMFIGVLLGLFIAAYDYVNAAVIHGVYIIGNQLPSIVFGTAVALLLIWNPLAGRRGQSWVFKPAEIAVIVALSLAVCAWPGSNFMRHFVTTLAMPGHLLKTKLNWQAANVMSLVPAGQGVLLNDGQPHPVATDLLIQGSGQPLGLTELPWRVWWPAIRLWGGVAVALAVAALCLALIVHPQWSQRELLPYPIARFLREVVQPSARGGWPLVAQSKLFWCGFGVIFVVHLLNGLNAWFPGVVKIPLQYDFSPLQQLFPNASKLPGAYEVFQPRIFPSIIAFAFFLSTEVSFSMGVMGFVYLGFGGLLLGQGISVTGQGLEPGLFSLMIFGGYLAFTVMILYVGRRYYRNVAGSVLGLPRQPETPAYATWAGRGLLVCAGSAMWLLCRTGGVDWLLSGLLVLVVLSMFLTLSRIYAETGALAVQVGWSPAVMLISVLGIQAVGPTAYIVMAIASILLAIDTRETWIGYFVNGLQLTDSTGGISPRKLAPWLLMMLLAGGVVAFGVGFWGRYTRGVNHADRWAVEWVPGGTFDSASLIATELAAHDELADATRRTGLQRLAALNPKPRTLFWIGLGAALVAGCAVARLRLPWWPLHPVLFLIWGTWAGYAVTVSFFIGWAVKFAVVKLGGARSCHTVKPLMVGVIAGEILMALSWTVVGALYYFVTGLSPKTPLFFP